MADPLTVIKHAWGLFTNTNNKNPTVKPEGSSYTISPTRPRFTRGNERTIVTSVYNRIAIDASTIDVMHVRLDDEGRFKEPIKSNLNNCLTVEANIDQSSRAFMLDIVISLLDEGCVAVVPVKTTLNPNNTESYDIDELRTGRIVEWFPKHVMIRLYNDETGMYQDVTLPKSQVAIIENPLYTIMNEPNSTMQRLIHKLSLLDIIDEESSSGKMDLIIQLPYIIKNDTKRSQAEERRKQIEDQLRGSRYGVAYIDGTEKVTQLNRSVENNILKQVEYLTNLLYSQLGLTQTIMDGTADENAMNNYYNRTVEPVVSAIVDEFHRKFLTKTARTQGQAIMFFRDPFKLMSVTTIADTADKFTRNELLSSNEFRQIIGRKPSTDPKADMLLNKNISHAPEELDGYDKNNQKNQNEKSNNKEKEDLENVKR